MVMELIDTLAFQRLRRIKQLGIASLLFQELNQVDSHTLLEYSMLQEKFIEDFFPKSPEFSKNKFILYGAALYMI